MTQLEKLIIDLAEHCLTRLSAPSDSQMDDESIDDLNTAFFECSGYTKLAHIRNSGLTDQASKRLKEVEAEMARAMAELRHHQEAYERLLSSKPSPTKH